MYIFKFKAFNSAKIHNVLNLSDQPMAKSQKQLPFNASSGISGHYFENIFCAAVIDVS